MDAAAHTPTRNRRSARTTALIATYVVLGLLSMGLAALAVWLADPCSPFAASSEDAPYTEFADGVMGGFGLLYLAGSIPLAVWRNRAVAWGIVAATFLLTTVGAIALLLTAAPAGTFCDLGGG